MGNAFLYEEKQRTYLIFYALIVAIIAIEVLAIVVQLVVAKDIIEAVAPLALSIILLLAFSFVLINFFYLRLRITERELTVSYGIFRLRIPVNEIKSCEPATFSWKTYLGWGIRLGLDGTFAWTSRGRRGIRVRTKHRQYVISTENADKICKVLGTN